MKHFCRHSSYLKVVREKEYLSEAMLRQRDNQREESVMTRDKDKVDKILWRRIKWDDLDKNPGFVAFEAKFSFSCRNRSGFPTSKGRKRKRREREKATLPLFSPLFSRSSSQ